jgi:hypothetical protein
MAVTEARAVDIVQEGHMFHQWTLCLYVEVNKKKEMPFPSIHLRLKIQWTG